MFCWGANSHGQLGLGYHSELIERPQQVESLPFEVDNVTSIGCGGGHILISTDSGDLYATGWNNRGQLGLGHTEDGTRFALVGRFHFEKITCGWDVSGGITVDDGDLYLWGSNVWQQVSCSGEKFVPTPTKLSLPAGSKAKKVCFGLRHTCILTENGTLLLLGKSKWIQREEGNVWTTVAHVPSSSGIGDFYSLELAEKITDVASGENHLVVRLENGSVICIGDNKFGQSANGADLNAAKRAIVKLESGWSHSGYLTKAGQVYLWGRNNYGQLGGRRADVGPNEPALLDLESNVTEFCLGSQHGLALTATDGLFTWGWNEHGNCGTGGTDNVLTPTKLEGLRKVTKIAAGAGFCCVLVKKA